jgi:DNA-binding transcriptional LysR family regulator
LAKVRGKIRLKDLVNQNLIVFPKDPRPSYADHVLSLVHDQGIQLGELHEVREIQAALGLVASEIGVCIVPAAARVRSDLVYRVIADERATSPIILSHRLNDDSWYISAVKELIVEMYAENPPWLDLENNAIPSLLGKEASITTPAKLSRRRAASKKLSSS